jgi:hypothetical protein
MSASYPPQVAAEICDVLQWFDAHPGAAWQSMGPLHDLYRQWRDVIKGDKLLNENGDMFIVPSLSGVGRRFLFEHALKPNPTQAAASCAEQRLEPKAQSMSEDGATSPATRQPYISLAEAERISGINRGVISRAIDAGALESNGCKGRGRKVDAADFSLWQIRRAKGPERKESDQHVISQIKKHVHD